jgi:ribosomal protein S18 acetylase RimI-like enzyme
LVDILKAQTSELEEIVQIDCEVIGNKERMSYIREAIEAGRCLVGKENHEIGGFLIYHTHFFENAFISLVIVSPSKRRRGYASRLIDYMVQMSPTDKIFSSTNRSNHSMQNVFKSSGFQESGTIENLDEGDPELIFYKHRQVNDKEMNRQE